MMTLGRCCEVETSSGTLGEEVDEGMTYDSVDKVGNEVRARLVGRRMVADSERLLLGDQVVQDRSFAEHKWVQLAIWGSTVDRCSFDKQRVEAAQVGGGPNRTIIRDCTFNDSQWGSTSLGKVRFERCSFLRFRANAWLARRVDLVQCTFSGQLRDAVFWASDPQDPGGDGSFGKNEIARNDFSACDLVGPAFRGGIDLIDQRMPIAPHYLLVVDARAAVARAYADVVTWKDLEWRRKALNALKTMRSDIDTGQLSLLLDKRLRAHWPIGLLNAFFGLFERVSDS